MADDSVWFCDNSWHAKCFRCKKCDKRLQAGSYMEHEKEPYCEKCYHEDVNIFLSFFIILFLSFYDNVDEIGIFKGFLFVVLIA
jgi:hypothetical protein